MMQAHRIKSKGRKKKVQRSQQTELKLLQVPEISTNLSMTCTYRFSCVAANVYNITKTNIGHIGGGTCTVVNSTLTAWAGSFKVHYVEIFQPALSGATQQVSLQWQSLGGVQSKQYTANSLSSAYPSHIKMRPPQGTMASFQNSFSSDVLFTIGVAVGAIIDVHVTHWTYDTGSAGFTRAIAAGTLGVHYWSGLDGSANLVPVGRVSTN